jgi:hypothetical protein
MRYYITLCILALSLAATSCKKKTTPLPTTMTFVLDKDTLWTTTNVQTDNKNNGTVYINAVSSDGQESLDITLSGYTGAKKTFLVDYRGTGGNINGNTGMYRNGTDAIMARAGKIVITSVSDELITGTFDLFYLQTNFKGSFTAPAK